MQPPPDRGDLPGAWLQALGMLELGLVVGHAGQVRSQVQLKPMDGRSFGAVVLAGVLTGSELTSRAIVHPALWKLNHAEQVRAEKLVYKRFGSVDPFLMTATTAACFIAASGLRGRSATLALAAGGSYSTMLAITLIGNMRINLRVFRWDEHEGDPEEWRRLRRRWDRLHSVRIPLDVAGFVLITLAALQA